ncbi:hypothetical protein JR316_0002482 [Psilocybe cubensis]|uniref:Uncharacterized protein n=2 Tax=Psilocybe cubensis TaxID=181762 RepID=A0ACB8HD43_PSICU|nr:hypothetical protein JR316_0002482 [Psilocybe cubensis]KAH9485572.1 hypothetical protein JR316_0002482 [Psilocybe cubensis]
MFAKILCISLLAATLPVLSVSHNARHVNRHSDLAKRADSDIQVFKRFAGSHWTYYDVEETGNAGSCGKHHVNTDFTVAMNAAQMNPGWCFKTIVLTLGSKSTTATISDTCPGCPYGGLDLTEGLFAFFLGRWPEGGGVFTGDWEFTDAIPAKPVSPPITTSKPTVTPKPAPASITTTSKHSSTTTSRKFSSSSILSFSNKVSSISSISSTSPVSPTSSINYLTGAASGLAIPTGTIDRTGSTPSNLQDLNELFVQLGGLAMVAASL